MTIKLGRHATGLRRRTEHAAIPPALEIWPELPHSAHVAPCRIVIIDDHVVVRDGLAALLGLEPDLEIVGCGGDVSVALTLVRTVQPDLVICDLNLPGISGAQAVQAIRREAPTVAVLVLSAHESLEYIRAAFNGGAIGYVCKDAPRSELLRAVRRAASGQHTTCGKVWDTVVVDWLEHCTPPAQPLTADVDEEACRVLRAIALGVPTWRIAQDLGRGVKVVEKYRTSLMRRLGLKSAAAVTRFAVNNRLVSSLELDRMLQARKA
jgi:two-component system, NarL family, response regulator NreC